MKAKNSPRSCILRVGAKAGRLCALMSEQENTIASTTNTEASMSEEDSSLLIMVMVDLLKELYATSISLNLHWVRAVHSKLELNRRKYPVELCKVRRCRYCSCLVECVKTNIYMSIGVSVCFLFRPVTCLGRYTRTMNHSQVPSLGDHQLTRFFRPYVCVSLLFSIGKGKGWQVYSIQPCDGCHSGQSIDATRILLLLLQNNDTKR